MNWNGAMLNHHSGVVMDTHHEYCKDAKDECQRILEKFQIQVESPIVILQQDEAKEMLKVESADKLYKFFEKATLIRQCFDQYSAAQVSGDDQTLISYGSYVFPR